MARFSHFEPCPKCGSRDNLARYDDGGAFCFGCKHWEPRNATSIFNLQRISDSHSLSEGVLFKSNAIQSAESGSTTLPGRVLDWLKSYAISPTTASRCGFRWNARTSQLIFPLYNQAGQIVATQSRNFDPDRAAKAKYFNSGSKEEAFPLYQKETPSVGPPSRASSSSCPNLDHRVTITEDLLSAIRVSKFVDAMPALGTSLSMSKALALQKMGYTTALVWLDRDKWKEGMDICDKFKWLGLSTRAIYTEKDPKEYSDEQIQEYLNE